MKKIIKKIMIVAIICMITGMSFTAFIFTQSGKNKEEYIACFETKPLAYRSFRHISKWPRLMASTTFLVKYPNGLWKLPAYCSYANLRHCLKHNKRIDTECKITFIDGMNEQEISDIINKNENFSGPKVLIEEGTLFPETYCFKAGYERSVIIKMAKKLMREKVDKLWIELEKHANTRGVKLPIDKNEFIILASIIQKEGATHQDMHQIAGCFLIRLQKNIRLHSCATVLYGMKKAGYKIYMRDNVPVVLLKDTKIKTSYNTYLLDRLPVGPICCPGSDALDALAQALHDGINNAAVTPKGVKMQYKAPLYFYAHDGKIIYANTLEMHNRNKYRYSAKNTMQKRDKTGAKTQKSNQANTQVQKR